MGRHQYHKVVREVVAEAVKLGFHDEGIVGSGHIRLRHPNGIMILSSSPSKTSAARNSLARIKRIAEGREK